MAHATIAVFHRRLAGRQGHRSLSRMQARVILMTASVYRAAVMRERRPVGPRVRPSPYAAARSVRPRLESAGCIRDGAQILLRKLNLGGCDILLELMELRRARDGMG
jgi:hypothetical protein